MTDTPKDQPERALQPRDESDSDFAKQAEAPDRGLFAEFVAFLGENKRWWLIPIIISLILLGFLLFLGQGPLAPFVYTLF
jgi:hypothetical protein